MSLNPNFPITLDRWIGLFERVNPHQDEHPYICHAYKESHEFYGPFTREDYKGLDRWKDCCHTFSLSEIISRTQKIFKASNFEIKIKSFGHLYSSFRQKGMDVEKRLKLTEDKSDCKIAGGGYDGKVTEIADEIFKGIKDDILRYKKHVFKIEQMYLKSKARQEARYSEGLLGKISWFFWNMFWNQGNKIEELKKWNLTDHVIELVKDEVCLDSKLVKLNSTELCKWLHEGTHDDEYGTDDPYYWNKFIVYHRVLKQIETLNDDELQKEVSPELNSIEKTS